MTPTERSAIEQLRALPNPLYEVGVLKHDAEGQPIMLTRTWDAPSVAKSVSWLAYENAHGSHIYIRPASDKVEHPYSLVDDLTQSALQKMQNSGYQPAAIVETSPGNFQAWLNHGEVLPHDVSTAAARHLARAFGADVKAADYRHFGRLAGFTNRKEKYARDDGAKTRYPWVKLIEASGRIYDQAHDLLRAVRSELEQQQQRIAEVAKRFDRTRQQGQQGPARKTIEDFRRDPRWQGDGNRVDIAYAKYAIGHNAPMSDVRASIASRDLTKKGGPRQQASYIDRTINKAIGGLGR